MCVLLVTAASLLTVLAYPYIQEKASRWHAGYEQSVEESSRAEQEASVQIMNSIYQAWREQKQKEAGQILTPSQVFLPQLSQKLTKGLGAADGEGAASEEDEFDYYGYSYEELQSTMDSTGREWQSFAREYSQVLPYQMTDIQGNVLNSNVENPSAYFSKALGENQIRLSLHFDSSGAMEVKSVEGPETNRDRMGNLMTNYQFYDPLEARLSGDYRYGGVVFFHQRADVGGAGLFAPLNDVQPVLRTVQVNLSHGVGHSFVSVQKRHVVSVHKGFDVLPAGDRLAAQDARPIGCIKADISHGVGDDRADGIVRAVVGIDVIFIDVARDPGKTSGVGKLPGVAAVGRCLAGIFGNPDLEALPVKCRAVDLRSVPGFGAIEPHDITGISHGAAPGQAVLGAAGFPDPVGAPVALGFHPLGIEQDRVLELIPAQLVYAVPRFLQCLRVA